MKKSFFPLTIGMPVYNEEGYIGEAIESLLSQTYKDFILIISDNASTDRTSQICKLYAEKDKRIIFLKHDKNNGAYFNFKFVLDKADTPFFMWCGGHDKCSPQLVEKLIFLIQKNDLALIYAQTREIKIDGTLGDIYEDDYTTSRIEGPADRYLYILKNIGRCNIFHGIWKTQVLKKCYFKPIIGCDVLILLQAALYGKFQQYNQLLFFRRTVREETNQHFRQFRDITGNRARKIPNNLFLKGKFISENIKMLYEADSQLSAASKFFLSVQTAYTWITKLYILFPLGEICKKIMPGKVYLSLKDKIKNKKTVIKGFKNVKAD